jgi:nucleotide-binding universal stress UspA family protein
MGLTFRKILVPTDFSETASTALQYAKELARQFVAELHLLHVCEDRCRWQGGLRCGRQSMLVRKRAYSASS